jgi:sugar phosphate isomerase/epimerase
MKISQVAVQLYTLRDFCKNEADFARTLDRVREIGYQAVQVSGVSADIPAATIRRLLEERGLVCCATHEGSDKIRRSPAEVADRLDALNCKVTAYPYPSGVEFNSEESVAALVADLDRAGAVLAARGQILCYHNHAHEFYRVGGRTILERIYAETKPANLGAELDTFWVQAGGGDPVSWINRVKGRIPVIHLKDYTVRADGTRDFAEIGHGNLEWKPIIAAAEAAGCRWFIVEQDTCPGDPFDSVRKSFEFIRANLVS